MRWLSIQLYLVQKRPEPTGEERMLVAEGWPDSLNNP